ncbi:S-adenosylmethionine:tRNA ribosyltransferase-isomerase [Pseudonocardia kunmingensis]|uniref:S-adenosylmethionine:tRNA ribosyltransferase-isomerase n=1 Tax=Pseudonocardia kunmingensis TaxID=630975 RepID=A0A543CYM3_9PSEU|nr:S-adenosylmethionine:tRNA ribosyltransferase-isomerase [Pseudonocardia kunmingensis]TQM02197.1 S-adenosylmethionine:tRNA ribosyltransferase-isomerase [Pseudonocardia kunmingensis]
MTAPTRRTGRPAAEPPEERGIARDEVRLLVARERGPLRHTTFRALPTALRRGDLVVVNTSDTEPAAVDGLRADGSAVTLHVSGPAPDDLHVVELRTPDGRTVTDGVAGESVHLPCGVVAALVTGHPDPRAVSGSGPWRARIPVAGGLRPWLACTGRPISSCGSPRWPLESYRTMFSRPEPEFGSAEMPSAGRPFTPEVLYGLRARGVGVARLVLHAGLSSPAAGAAPLPERYRVPPATADAVNAAHAGGGRVVAVGATVARALETVADPSGRVTAGAGWTHLLLGARRGPRVVDGLLTGWHDPAAAHLMALLDAVAGARLVDRAYAAAVEHGYRWHEFGDSCLLLSTCPAHRVR